MSSHLKPIVIAASQMWDKQICSKLQARLEVPCFEICRKEDLTLLALDKIGPSYVFFPHWSYFVPTDIHKKYECIIFHMTDLPYGRGGSPLQNLIVAGKAETVMSAIKCVDEVDAGPIYLKRPLSLDGTAEAIYLKATFLIEEMIVEIVTNKLTPTAQSGPVHYFTRRTPAESNLANVSQLKSIYDYIRMLDAPGYPHAFVETNEIRFEFTNAQFGGDCVLANVKITKRPMTVPT